jgi:hypothetical protein
MKYLDLNLKEKLIRQTSFLQKKPSQKPASFRVNILFISQINETTLCRKSFGPKLAKKKVK